MSEHLLFLQAAGSDFGRAHDLVNAVKETVRASHNAGDSLPVPRPNLLSMNHGLASGRPRPDPERLAERLGRAGWKESESLHVAVATLVTTSSPLGGVDVDWVASASARIGDPDLLLETAGVIFAFNTINRIADARRVRLEYRFLRELRPIKGWVERRFASLAGLAYDLSYRYSTRRSAAEMLDRLGTLFVRHGATGLPDVFHWLSRSPVVLEGVLEMIEAVLTSAGVRSDLLKEAAGIAVASRAMPNSGLRRAVDQWLSRGSLPDSDALCSQAASARASDPGLEAACRRYTWQVANAAYTVSEDQVRRISALGLSDAELLDLTLAVSVFTALAIIEPLSSAVAATGGVVAPVRNAI